MQLWTGSNTGKPVTAVADRALYSGIEGRGSYVFEHGSMLEAAMSDANHLSIMDGEVLHHGAHITVDGSEEWVIPSGVQGAKRSHIAVIRYTSEKDGGTIVERANPVVLSGEPALEGDPQDPQIETESILDGAVVSDMPLYRVVTDGLAVGEPERLFETIPSIEGMVSMLAGKADKAHKHSAADVASGTLPVARGGTGVTSDAAIALKSYPVGSVYLSFDPTSPASLFGGTWAQISGRFLRAANDTAAGGSDSHTLTAAQMPSHAHVWKMGGKERVGYGISGSAGSFVDGLALASSGSAISIDPSGGGQTHNNMPAYQDVYAWRRTA